MLKFLRVTLPVILSLMCTVTARAQSVATGTPPFGTIGGGSVDQIDLANLNIHFCIPIMNKTGRGTPFTYSMCYDSSIWSPGTAWVPTPAWGWMAETPTSNTAVAVTGYLDYDETDGACYGYDNYGNYVGQVGDSTYYGNFTYHDRLGVAHAINYSVQQNEYWGWGPEGGSDNCASWDNSYNTYGDGTTSDASGYLMNISSYDISSGGGAAMNEPINSQTGAATYTDRNGNEISTDGQGHFMDTLGKTALTISGSNPVNFAYTAPSGGTAAYQMKYTNQTVKTNFQCSGVTDYTASNVPLVSEIDLPDYNSSTNPSSRYTFTYEQTPGYSGDVTGRIESITLPTGGTISYTYTGGNNGIECADGSTSGLTRQTPDTGSSNPWTYSRTLGSQTNFYAEHTSTLTTTDPDGNQSVMVFNFTYLTEEDDYSGTAGGTPLRSTYNCYNSPTATPPCNSGTFSTYFSAPITEIRSFLQWGGASGLESLADTQYDWAGSAVEKDEYAYGTSPHGALVRKTLSPHTGGTPDLLESTTVEDGSGAVASKETFTYDGAILQGTSGTPQHVSGVNAGNLTSESVLVAGSTYLTKSFTYYDTGNLYQSTDVNSGTGTVIYGACGNSFPTEIDEAISGLKQYASWDSGCNGGVQISATDENGQTVTTTYSDPYFWRPASATDQAGNVTYFTYDDYNGSTPASVEGKMSFNAGVSATDVLATVDLLGRQQVSQVREAPASSIWDSVESDYDELGEPTVTSMPYSASASIKCSPSPCPGTGATYDAIGRTHVISNGGGGAVTNTYFQNDIYTSAGPAPSGENTKDRQLEYDALGRLTSVCEITSGTSAWPNGSCGQTHTANGYLTRYIYDLNDNLIGVTQNAQTGSSIAQARSYAYDDLGRIISENNPESGTTTYVYDTDSICGTYKGDLVKKSDAIGNSTCYAYDALHRLTSVTYPSGPYAGVTPQKHFTYDSATVDGVVMSNVKGRVAEAYTTCNSPCTGKSTTDEGMSYTVRGETSDIYESTSDSAGYFHVSETYWANGERETIGGLPGVPTITYHVDGEGRVTTATASSGQNPLTGTTYQTSTNPPGPITQVAFGSGDSDSFSYDGNTGRVTSYNFNVNGSSDSGTLTWNPLGTLSQLAISDSLNSSDTQTCMYMHDDLSRLAGTLTTPGVNCNNGSTTIFSQTFSYDPFGNITKSGSKSFVPSYEYNAPNPTNQFSSVGSSTAQFDGDGNVLTDTVQNYTWDVNGRPTSAGNVNQTSINLTYDALGNMVQQNSGSAYTQIVYAPDGTKLAFMNGTATLVKAFVPLTGGATAVYNSTGLAYYRHSDWLGSSRLTSSSGSPTQMVSDQAYAPFGETYAASGSNPDLSFTGMNQDTAQTVYDFPAREYGSLAGRWASPDPLGMGAVDNTDPQSWNRYAYVRNSPLTITDPDGRDYYACIDTTSAEFSNAPVMADGCGVNLALSGSGLSFLPTSDTSGVIIQDDLGQVGWYVLIPDGSAPAPAPIVSETDYCLYSCIPTDCPASQTVCGGIYQPADQGSNDNSGASGGGGGPSNAAVIQAALSQPKVPECLKKFFPGVNNPMSHAPKIVEVSAKLIQSLTQKNNAMATYYRGNVAFNRSYWDNPDNGGLWATSYIHEWGNLLSIQAYHSPTYVFWNMKPKDYPISPVQDSDAGVVFEYCVFGTTSGGKFVKAGG